MFGLVPEDIAFFSRFYFGALLLVCKLHTTIFLTNNTVFILLAELVDTLTEVTSILRTDAPLKRAVNALAWVQK